MLANWEIMVLTAAKLRARLGVPGMSHDAVRGFRDKQLMKERVAAAGLRVPRSARIRSADEARAAAATMGYPLVLKPIAGAGSADTYQVDSARDLERVLALTQHVPEVSLEEFIDGDEFTFDTVCIGGKPAFMNVAQYLPKPLIARSNEWVSPVIVTVRNLDQPAMTAGLALGKRVLGALGVEAVAALGLETGVTHMEWFRRDDGSLAIGEIAARPPGAHIVLANGYAHDADLYRAWARAVVDEAFDGPWPRKYAVGVAYLRGVGRGRVVSVRGVDKANQLVGHLAVESRLPKPGTPRADSYEGDGYIVVRDPDTEVVKRAVSTLIETIQIDYA